MSTRTDVGRGPMKTYVILRRRGWATPENLQAAGARSTAEGDKTPDDLRWIRSYATAETDGSPGTICIYQASGEEAIREHAVRAEIPADEIFKVVDTVIVRPDPS